MVSLAKLVVMAVCVLICIVAIAIPTYLIKCRSSKIETGLSGAIGYGFLGYIWQYVFLMFAVVLVSRFLISGKNVALLQFLLTFVTTAWTAVSLYWGIYLTNQRQISIYRSAAVGIGFSLGKMGIDLIYPYATSFYFSLQINAGTFHGEEALRYSILETSIPSLFAGTYKCLLMFVMIFAIALIMGHYYIAGKKQMAWLSVLGIYEVIMLINMGLQFTVGRLSQTANDIAFMIVFTVVAALAVLVLYHWLRTDEVEWNPQKLLQKMKR